MQFSLSIPQWYACSPYHLNLEDWQQWAKDPNRFIETHKPQTIQPTFIPTMQRRRLSTPAKLMFTALHALNLPNDTPILFASHDGETNRSFSLWLQLLKEGAMSPMSFGLSVHNAQTGLWSLFTKNQSEMNAICCGDGQLETALAEAVMLLMDGKERVAVVIVEDPLPEAYNVRHAERAPYPFALAITVQNGEDYMVRFEGETYEPSPSTYTQPLEWITQMINRTIKWQYKSAGGVWYWERME